jgi:putative endonuclease
MAQNQNQVTGAAGEAFTMNYLRGERFSILAQNFRTQRGEVDIIAQRENVIAFVEVKTRQSRQVSLHGLISPAKQRKIILAAKQFIGQMLPQKDLLFRFDVALLHYEKETGQHDLEYISNAFGESNEPTY